MQNWADPIINKMQLTLFIPESNEKIMSKMIDDDKNYTALSLPEKQWWKHEDITLHQSYHVYTQMFTAARSIDHRFHRTLI